jgi:two-component system, response regulator PdtaR
LPGAPSAFPRYENVVSALFLRAASASDESGLTASKIRVLIVEDEFLVAWQLETAFRRSNMDVVGVADTVAEAIRLAESERPTVVIMDVRLGGHRDGIDAARELYSRFGLR